MRMDIDFKIRALVSILRRHKIKAWCDFKGKNKGQLQGAYGKLVIQFRTAFNEHKLILTEDEFKWCKAFKVI